jgi:hypothetical protein
MDVEGPRLRGTGCVGLWLIHGPWRSLSSWSREPWSTPASCPSSEPWDQPALTGELFSFWADEGPDQEPQQDEPESP